MRPEVIKLAAIYEVTPKELMFKMVQEVKNYPFYFLVVSIVPFLFMIGAFSLNTYETIKILVFLVGFGSEIAILTFTGKTVYRSVTDTYKLAEEILVDEYNKILENE